MKNAEPVPAPRADSEKEFRTRAMARPRTTARNYPHRRRSAARMPGTMAVTGDEAGLLRRYWDEHAIKAGMAVFWGWFLLANWSNLAQVAQEFAGF